MHLHLTLSLVQADVVKETDLTFQHSIFFFNGCGVYVNKKIYNLFIYRKL